MKQEFGMPVRSCLAQFLSLAVELEKLVIQFDHACEEQNWQVISAEKFICNVFISLKFNF